MKTKIMSVVMLLGLSSLTLFAGPDKTEKFKVAGNCGMCETRIEKAANSIEGVTKADWDKETKMIEVIFDSDKTDLIKIEKAIAKVGHDTESFKSNDETYDKLPSCCKYDRMSYNTSDESECTKDHD